MLNRNRSSNRVLGLLMLALGLVTAAPLTNHAAADGPVSEGGLKWEFLDQDDGIDIWKLEIPGKELPGFRGQVIINASMQHILDEMMDSKHHKDWMYRIQESSVLEELSASDAIVYSRTSAPWPVADRDVILKVGYHYNADKSHLIMRFKNIDSNKRKVPANVVRMPYLSGFYKMWKIGENKTKVLYEVEADIGGSIPLWIAKKASKDLPYITLSALRTRVMQRAKQ